MISKDFFAALNAIATKNDLDKEVFKNILEDALSSAYRRKYGEAQNARVELNEEKNTIKIYSYKTVVEEVEDEEKEISLEEAKMIKKSYKVGDKIEKMEDTKNDFGRVAALTVKSVLTQRMKEIERETLTKELITKENKLITVKVTKIESDCVFVDVGINNYEAMMNTSNQIPGEKYYVGQKLKVYVHPVKQNKSGPSVHVSRGSIPFLIKLFELEIPEIENGLVEIKSVSREAGNRAKIAIHTEDKTVDALGACVGPNSRRINSIINEINGEKIDLILWDENVAEFVLRALSPAQCVSVEYSQADNTSLAIVEDDKLSLAIGRKGCNVKLASKLTGVRINVKSESQIGEEEITEKVNFNDDFNDDIDLEDMFKDEE